MMSAEKPLLHIRNLSVTYMAANPPVTAVSDISLQVKQGESLGIIGESGCGKSTLALSIMRLLKDVRTEGEIFFEGVNLVDLPEQEIRKRRWNKIALVFQNSLEVLNPVLTIAEQIGEPIWTHEQLTAEESDQRIINVLNMVGLDPDWRTAYPHQLSGGMRQRVLLAMALICEPELLIVDEPTTALDAASKNEIFQLLQNLQKQLGFAMILISHDVAFVSQLTSLVMTMYSGQVVEYGRTSDVLKNPMHCYTRGLLNSSPQLFKYKDLWGISGEPPGEGSPPQGCPFKPRCCQSSESCEESRPELRYVALERQVACHKGGIETFLKAEGMKKSYRVGQKVIEAVRGADLEIRSGEVVALVGESGSGKSTLAHTLVGVLPADEGSVFFRGKKVDNHWATRMIGGMQIIFQDPFSATSHRMQVLDVVKEPLDIMKWKSTKERNEAACRALQAVRLPMTPDFLQRYCYSLSGGQRQRVAIARALVTKPNLVIADEITSMLDPSNQANILRELKGLQNKFGFAMLYITHELHLARKVSDKVYVMHEGEIVEKGSSSDIFEKPEHLYTKQLFQEAFSTSG
jgi:peptide/nickel transport system ATP-binding protein